MAKHNEKQIAYAMYVDQCLTAKEISGRIKVSEKTISKWVDAGNWKEIRLSKQSTSDVLVQKQRELLQLLLDKRLKFERQAEKTDKDKEDYKSVIDEMSKVAAMIDRTSKEGSISMRVHIHCLEKFMGSLHQKNTALYLQLLDFQLEYLQLLADELK